MKTKIYFAMYKFNIRYKNKKRIEKNYMQFDSIKREDENLNLMDFFENIFPKNKFIYDNLRVTETLEINNEEHYISGLINLGEYGNVRNIYNKTDGEFKEKVEENDVVCEPFFFRMTIPPDSNEGFLILEKKKSKPFTRSFFDCLKEKIKKEYNDFIRFDFIHVIPLEAEPLFNNSDVVEFIFVENEKNSQKFGNSQINFEKKKIIWDVRKNKFKLEDVKSENFLTDLKTIFKNYVPYAKVKQESKREMIVNLEDIFENKIFYLQLENIKWGDDKNPKYEYLNKLAEKYTKSNFSYCINKRSIFNNDKEN